MAPEEIVSQLGLWMVNFFLQSYTFCLKFILFYLILPDPQVFVAFSFYLIEELT